MNSSPGDHIIPQLERDFVNLCFGAHAEWLMSTMHLIVPNRWSIVRELSDIFQCNPGVWGELAYGDDPEGAFYSPISREVPFSIWNSEINQAYVERIIGALGRHTFCMLVSAESSIEQLDLSQA